MRWVPVERRAPGHKNAKAADVPAVRAARAVRWDMCREVGGGDGVRSVSSSCVTCPVCGGHGPFLLDVGQAPSRLGAGARRLWREWSSGGMRMVAGQVPQDSPQVHVL